MGEHRIRHLANASKFACTVHSGQIWDIVQVIMALMMWIKTNGYEMAGGIHEIHLSGKETSKTDFDNIVFEFQIPVQPFRT
jgi:effector-binding domain-containing protein